MILSQGSDVGLTWRGIGNLRVSLGHPENTSCLLLLVRFLNQIGKPFTIRQNYFSFFFLLLLAGRTAFLNFGVVSVAFTDIGVDAAGVITTSIEIVVVFAFVDNILSSVGECNKRHKVRDEFVQENPFVVQ